MKKILLLLTVGILIASCSIYIPYSLNTYSIDYSKYTKDGFFITESNSVSFDYDPVASVGAKETTGYTNAKEYEAIKSSKIKEDSVYGNSLEGRKEKRSPNPNTKVYATLETAIDAIVSETKQLGGNAIIGIKIADLGSSEFPEYLVTGMAVKRK